MADVTLRSEPRPWPAVERLRSVSNAGKPAHGDCSRASPTCDPLGARSAATFCWKALSGPKRRTATLGALARCERSVGAAPAAFETASACWAECREAVDTTGRFLLRGSSEPGRCFVWLSAAANALSVSGLWLRTIVETAGSVGPKAKSGTTSGDGVYREALPIPSEAVMRLRKNSSKKT